MRLNWDAVRHRGERSHLMHATLIFAFFSFELFLTVSLTTDDSSEKKEGNLPYQESRRKQLASFTG